MSTIHSRLDEISLENQMNLLNRFIGCGTEIWQASYLVLQSLQGLQVAQSHKPNILVQCYR